MCFVCWWFFVWLLLVVWCYHTEMTNRLYSSYELLNKGTQNRESITKMRSFVQRSIFDISIIIIKLRDNFFGNVMNVYIAHHPIHAGDLPYASLLNKWMTVVKKNNEIVFFSVTVQHFGCSVSLILALYTDHCKATNLTTAFMVTRQAIILSLLNTSKMKIHRIEVWHTIQKFETHLCIVSIVNFRILIGRLLTTNATSLVAKMWK